MISISFVDFYQDFNIHNNFFLHALRHVLGEIEVIPELDFHNADILLCSVFGSTFRSFSQVNKDRAIMWIGENKRPDYQRCTYSLSCDIDSYGGHNFRLPLWLLEIDWFNTGLGVLKPEDSEEMLCTFKPITKDEFEAKKFCITIFNNPEPTRVYLYEMLTRIGLVDGYGRPFGNWFPTSENYLDKVNRIKGYKFNLCPENSYWPGYYTEKCLHAKLAGCIPITLSDPYIYSDFNSKSFLNIYEFRHLDLLCRHINHISSDYAEANKYFAQPLLHRVPSITNILHFLEFATSNILAGRSKCFSESLQFSH